MKEKGLLGSIFAYAKPCKGKLTLSVLCALISVRGGIIPFVAAYHIIVMFLNETATAGEIIHWGLFVLWVS